MPRKGWMTITVKTAVKNRFERFARTHNLKTTDALKYLLDLAGAAP